MRYRRLFALLAAALLFSCIPVYARGSAGTEAANPPPGSSAQAPSPAAPPEGPACIAPPENSFGAASPGNAPPENSVPGGRGPLAQLPTDRQPDGPVTISLSEDWIIRDEQGLTTLSSRFANMSPSELAKSLGHPGITQPVTIQTNGHQIVIRKGGSLELQELNPDSPELCVEGEHGEGLFRVEEGGRLSLNQVFVKTDGTAVYLEERADYEWKNANGKPCPEPSKAGKAPPLEAVELYADPEPLLMFDGTAWSNGLPTHRVPSLQVFCSANGQREGTYRELKVAWDTKAQAGALSRREDCVLKGAFYDQEGAPIPSRFTPELPVRFLPRGPVEVVNSRFCLTGGGDYFGEITFSNPHEPESVRLEVSEDGGKRWSEVKNAIRLQRGATAQFYQPDARPRLYRIAVAGGPNEGVSEPVTLPEPPTVGSSSNGGSDDGDHDDDFSGNRGGGTALDPPERELASSAPESRVDAPPTAPAPSTREPLASATESAQSAPDAPDSSPVHEDVFPPAAGSASGPSKTESGQQAQAAIAPARPGETPREAPRTLSPAGQAAAAAAGIAACGGMGALAASHVLRDRLLAALRKLLLQFRH